MYDVLCTILGPVMLLYSARSEKKKGKKKNNYGAHAATSHFHIPDKQANREMKWIK